MASLKQTVQLSCPLEFAAETKPAMLLRITPQLRTALADAHAAGQQASIRFSGDSGGTVSLIQCSACILPKQYAMHSRGSACRHSMHTFDIRSVVLAQIITVGAQQYEVVTNPEGTCELMKLPPLGSGLPAVEVGVVQQKLLVQVRRQHQWPDFNRKSVPFAACTSLTPASVAGC